MYRLIEKQLSIKTCDIIIITEAQAKTVLGETTLIGITYFSDLLFVFMLFMVCRSTGCPQSL